MFRYLCMLSVFVVAIAAIAQDRFVTSGDFGAAAALEADGGLTGVDTDECVVAGNGAGGAVECSGVTANPAGELTVPGSIDAGSGSGAACLILRDSDNAGDSACEVLNGTFACEIDTNGICGDAT